MIDTHTPAVKAHTSSLKAKTMVKMEDPQLKPSAYPWKKNIITTPLDWRGQHQL